MLIRDFASDRRTTVSTAGIKRKPEDPDDPVFHDEQTSVFRSCAARGNYLSLDRPDLSFSAKETCRRMGTPKKCDLEAVEREARYLRGRPRLVYHASPPPSQEEAELVLSR